MLLLLCGIAGAVACGNKSPAPVADRPQLSRRAIQRANLEMETWQFVYCTEEDSLRDYLARMAEGQPFGKSIQLVACEAMDPELPAIVFGDRLPDPLTPSLQTLMASKPLQTSEQAKLFTLSNYLSPLTVDDSLPRTVSLYLSKEEGAILHHLRTADFSDWGGIFWGRWAYEIKEQDGTIRYGSYTGEDWNFGKQEIVLPPIGAPLLVRDGVAYVAVDSALTVVTLDRLLDEGVMDIDSTIDCVYLYPTVERIGLRRGSMAPRQVEGSNVHLVVDQWIGGGVADSSDASGFLRGMTFAHEGYRVYNGYGGSTVSPSLDSLASLNVNALAIVPYTYMRAADRVGDLPVPEDAGSENDAAVRYSIRQAHRRGWAVLLKPQIWVGGAWPGDVDFATEAEWDNFFNRYRRWMLHYARLAESERVAALCIGTELVQATLKYPDRWRELIGELRRVYRGKLTYAANWGREFEQLTFWQELDAIGLNSYYPLSTAREPTDAELLQGAQQWMRLADSISTAYDRPLWLTEVGYRSVKRAWINPHAEAGDRSASEEDQARCYAALLTAAAESTRLRGMFIWKWPSYLGYNDRGGEDTGFVPGGKPAASLLTDYYDLVDGDR